MEMRKQDFAGMRLTAHYNRLTEAQREGVMALWQTPQGELDAIFPRVIPAAQKAFHALREYRDAVMAWRSDEVKRVHGTYDFPEYHKLYLANAGASDFAPTAWR